jgi:hypothetical protein
MKKIVFFIIVVYSSSPLNGAQGRTLWDTVREHDASTGPVEVVSSVSYEPKDIGALLSEADFAIQGIIVKAESGLNHRQTAIVTTYELRPLRVLFTREPSQSPRLDDTITFQHLGGKLEMLGVNVSMKDDLFRQLSVKQNLVVFLKRVEGSFHHYVVGGPFGCFPLRGTRLSTMDLVAKSVHTDLDGADLSHLIRRIQEVTNQRRP